MRATDTLRKVMTCGSSIRRRGQDRSAFMRRQVSKGGPSAAQGGFSLKEAGRLSSRRRDTTRGRLAGPREFWEFGANPFAGGTKVNRLAPFPALTGTSLAAADLLEVSLLPDRLLPDFERSALPVIERKARELPRPVRAVSGVLDERAAGERPEALPVHAVDVVMKGLIVVDDLQLAVLSSNGADVVVRDGETPGEMA